MNSTLTNVNLTKHSSYSGSQIGKRDSCKRKMLVSFCYISYTQRIYQKTNIDNHFPKETFKCRIFVFFSPQTFSAELSSSRTLRCRLWRPLSKCHGMGNISWQQVTELGLSICLGLCGTDDDDILCLAFIKQNIHRDL